MRAALFVALALGVTMTTAMAEEPKKDEKKKDPTKLADYDEKVTVQKLNGKTFLNPVKDVPAYRIESKGQLYIFTMPPAGNAQTPKGSLITDKDGNTYVTTKSDNNALGFTLNEVKLKPKDK